MLSGIGRKLRPKQPVKSAITTCGHLLRTRRLSEAECFDRVALSGSLKAGLSKNPLILSGEFYSSENRRTGLTKFSIIPSGENYSSGNHKTDLAELSKIPSGQKAFPWRETRKDCFSRSRCFLLTALQRGRQLALTKTYASPSRQIDFPVPQSAFQQLFPLPSVFTVSIFIEYVICINEKN